MLQIDSKISEDIKRVIQEGYDKVNHLWPIQHSVAFVLNTGTRRNGYCRKINQNSYKIAINKTLARKEDILEVVVHELLHSYPIVFPQGHRGEWIKRAQVVNRTYNLHVQRLNHYERTESCVPKYVFECTSCRRKWNYYKKPVWFNNVHKAECPYCKTQTIALLESLHD